MYFSQGFTGEL